MDRTDVSDARRGWLDRLDRWGRVVYWPAGAAAVLGAVFTGVVALRALADGSLPGVVAFGSGLALFSWLARICFTRRRLTDSP